MWKRMLLMLLCVALTIAGIAYLKFRQIQAGIAMGKSFAPPPAAVTTLVVRPETWQPSIKVIGSLKAVQGVTVSTDLAGIVSEIAFESGKVVKKGDLLVQLNPDQETAQLEAAEARLDLANLDLARKRELQTKAALASSEIDVAENELRQAKAALAQTLALVRRKHITAPFDGTVGIRQVSLGQFLNPGSPIVTMHSLDPILVNFTIPQQQLPLAPVGKPVRVSAEGIPSTFEGTITATDSHVDNTSRAITLEASLPNPGALLRPGMFVNVEILQPEEKDALTVPASAISYAPYGDSVFVVVEGKTPEGAAQKVVEQRFIKSGGARGDQVRVLSGVAAGEEVVTSGVFKLRPGAPVQINNSVQPGNEAAPHPPNT